MCLSLHQHQPVSSAAVNIDTIQWLLPLHSSSPKLFYSSYFTFPYKFYNLICIYKILLGQLILTVWVNNKYITNKWYISIWMLYANSNSMKLKLNICPKLACSPTFPISVYRIVISSVAKISSQSHLLMYFTTIYSIPIMYQAQSQVPG